MLYRLYYPVLVIGHYVNIIHHSKNRKWCIPLFKTGTVAAVLFCDNIHRSVSSCLSSAVWVHIENQSYSWNWFLCQCDRLWGCPWCQRDREEVWHQAAAPCCRRDEWGVHPMWQRKTLLFFHDIFQTDILWLFFKTFFHLITFFLHDFFHIFQIL